MVKRVFAFSMVLAGLLCLAGTSQMPFEYYSFLRGAISFLALQLTAYAVMFRKFGWIALSAVSFILFFPLFDLEFAKKVWVYVDVVIGMGYLAGGLVLSGKES